MTDAQIENKRRYHKAYRQRPEVAARLKAYDQNRKHDHAERVRSPAYRAVEEARLIAKYGSVRGYMLWRRYGMTLQDYDLMVVNQNNRCAICERIGPGGKHEFFDVDHDHQTKKVRALLCHPCNMKIGWFRDDPVLMRKAADYIDSHSKVG